MIRNISITFDVYTINSGKTMFTLQQYLGFLLFLTILTIGFWLMIFLIHFVFYWIFGATRELLRERKANKELGQA
ncbi:hypothetical protein FAQ01_20110 [Flavobacterium aquatile]|nr:hypothetical protein FAQ01_20110 [Flavobacterium aquatile]